MTTPAPSPTPGEAPLRRFVISSPHPLAAEYDASLPFAEVDAVDWTFVDGVFRFLLADGWITAAYPAANVFGVVDAGPLLTEPEVDEAHAEQTGHDVTFESDSEGNSWQLCRNCPQVPRTK